MNLLLRLPPAGPTRRLFTRQGRLLAAAAALLVLARPAAADLIVNGNFEAGTTTSAGFTTGYTVSPGFLDGPGLVDVTKNPAAENKWWPTSFGDHTTGSGFLLAINGATTPNTPVWSQTVAVTPGTNYNFSAWSANLYPTNAAKLDFLFNGTSIGTFSPGLTVGKWGEFSGSWNSGTATSVTISIIDRNLERFGNDFVIDDISMTGGIGTAGEAPEPSTLVLCGIGAVGGLAGYIRRRKAVAV